MAKKALVIKSQRKPKFKVRAYTRCRRCGRPHSVLRKFGLDPTLQGACFDPGVIDLGLLCEEAGHKHQRCGEGFHLSSSIM